MKKIRLLMVGAMVALFTLISAQTATAESLWIHGDIEGSWWNGDRIEVTSSGNVYTKNIQTYNNGWSDGYFCMHYYNYRKGPSGDINISATPSGITTTENAWKIPAGKYELTADMGNNYIALKDPNRTPSALYIIGDANNNKWNQKDNSCKLTQEGNTSTYSGEITFSGADPAWIITELTNSEWGAVNCYRWQLSTDKTTTVTSGTKYSMTNYEGTDNVCKTAPGTYTVTVDFSSKKVSIEAVVITDTRIEVDTEYTVPVNYADGITLTVAEGVKVTYPTTQAILPNVVLENGAEIKATGVTSVESLAIIKKFIYEGTDNKTEWFDLGLPFEVIANKDNGCVQYREITESSTPNVWANAEQGPQYATYDYNSQRRAAGYYGGNWLLHFKNDDTELGEFIQLHDAGSYEYKFTAADETAAATALTEGRLVKPYFEGNGDTDNDGWNVLSAGKTYSAKYTINSVIMTQVLQRDGTFKATTNNILAPGTAYVVQLSEESEKPTVTTNTKSDSDAAAVEKYTFELINAEGKVIDRIFIFDGSDELKYRVAKMSALKANTTQMSILANDNSYCAYSSLASEPNKSHTISLTNAPKGAKLIMTEAGNQSVSVDGVATTLDTAVDVTNGNINIIIGSQTSSVADATTSAVKVYAANGAIIIKGIASAYAITNMSGVTVATGVAESNTAVDVEAGIYIVNVAGEYSKIIVK